MALRLYLKRLLLSAAVALFPPALLPAAPKPESCLQAGVGLLRVPTSSQSAPITKFEALIALNEAVNTPYIGYLIPALKESYSQILANLQSTRLLRSSVARKALSDLFRSDEVLSLFNGENSGEIFRFLESLKSNPKAFVPGVTAQGYLEITSFMRSVQTILGAKAAKHNFGQGAAYLESVRRIAAGGTAKSPSVPETQGKVDGLYDSIDLTRAQTVNDHNGVGWAEIKIGNGWALRSKVTLSKLQEPEIKTVVVKADGSEVAIFKRALRPDRKVIFFELAERYAGSPSFVKLPGASDLVPDRGIPTQMAATLLGLRQAGVAPGTLIGAVVAEMSNSVSTFELLQIPQIRAWVLQHPERMDDSGKIPAELIELLERSILSTQTGRYIQSTLIQCGHRITEIRISEGRLGSIAELSQRPHPQGAAMIDAALREEIGGKPFVLSPDLLVPTNYRIEFRLAPL
jgi:hypothetical protein